MIEITPGVGISEHEISFSFDRTPGPGGQNSNKVNTRVTLHFNVVGSTSLSTQQKTKVRQTLASRINQEGILRVVSSKERTQLANRRSAVNRLIELLKQSFDTPKIRRKTKVPASADKKRLDGKVRQSTLKRSRQSVVFDD